MSITIQNISKQFDEDGLQDYVVKINNQEICRFEHYRKDGLMTCLLNAAIAVHEVDKANKKKEIKLSVLEAKNNLKCVSVTKSLDEKYGVKWKYNSSVECWESELGIVRACSIYGGYNGEGKYSETQLWFYPKKGKSELVLI